MICDRNSQAYQCAFQDIIHSLTLNKALKKNHAVIFLGGQPGAGKSTFTNMDYSFSDYIVIDGDQYRQFHPEYESILEKGIDKVSEFTQPFVNQVVEDLIIELSQEGYNLLIEGTLRDASVPIATSKLLKKKGYTTELYVMACDACESWESTVRRAELMKEIGQVPRIVPIDKYNYIVTNLPQSLQSIEESGMMDKLTIINRECRILWRNGVLEGERIKIPAYKALEKVLNLPGWKAFFNNFYTEKQSFNLPEPDIEQGLYYRRRGGR